MAKLYRDSITTAMKMSRKRASRHGEIISGFNYNRHANRHEFVAFFFDFLFAAMHFVQFTSVKLIFFRENHPKIAFTVLTA